MYVYGRRMMRSPLFNNIRPLGFFDGSSQEDGSMCGAGVVLKCDDVRVYNLQMGRGRGTNTRGELLALWLLLFFARSKMFSQV